MMRFGRPVWPVVWFGPRRNVEVVLPPATKFACSPCGLCEVLLYRQFSTRNARCVWSDFERASECLLFLQSIHGSSAAAVKEEEGGLGRRGINYRDVSNTSPFLTVPFAGKIKPHSSGYS